MAVFCGFVSFCNAHEKQQVFMQTVKSVFVCGCVRVVVYVCVCVRLCERERGRESSLEIHYTSTKVFVCFLVGERGGVCLSSARRPVRQAIMGASL